MMNFEANEKLEKQMECAEFQIRLSENRGNIIATARTTQASIKAIFVGMEEPLVRIELEAIRNIEMQDGSTKPDVHIGSGVLCTKEELILLAERKPIQLFGREDYSVLIQCAVEKIGLSIYRSSGGMP